MARPIASQPDQARGQYILSRHDEQQRSAHAEINMLLTSPTTPVVAKASHRATAR